MFATTGAQAVALFAVLSAASTTVNAFSPVFSTPRQCDSLKITWSSMELPPSSQALTEFTMSLVPLDDPKHHSPSPYMLTVPCTMLDEEGVLEVPALPFKAGTQFFASAHFPGASGPVRRMVSDVFTVEHSSDASCLDTAVPNAKRPRMKTFGKRQINVIGTGNAGASGSPAPASTSAAGVPINVIGVGVIPSGAAGTSQAASSTSGAASTSASAPAASGGSNPPIRVIGSSNIPASGSGNGNTPANAAPAPAASSSATGPVPPINVVGPGVIPANGGQSISTTSATQGAPSIITVGYGVSEASSSTSTPCTETPTSTEAAMPSSTTMAEMPMDDDEDDSEEEPCEDTTTSGSSVYGRPASTTTRAAAAFNTEVVQYGSFDDMVNAANSAFHAWNPYKPAYTPST